MARRTLTEMIILGQRRLDEMPMENPQWREDAEHEMGEEGEYQDALNQWYPGEEAEQAGYFESPGSWADPVAADVDVQGQTDADAGMGDYDSYDSYDPEDLEASDAWHTDASRWDEIAGIQEGDDEEESSDDVEAGEGEKGGWSTTPDGKRVNIPS